MDQQTATILTQSKSTGVAVILALLFGGLGLLYATVKGGIIMSIVTVVAWITIVVGIGLILVPICHLVSVIWAVTAVNAHNQSLIARVGR